MTKRTVQDIAKAQRGEVGRALVLTGMALVCGFGLGVAAGHSVVDPIGWFPVKRAVVVDGDTLALELVVHLDGTDAPELDAACAVERDLAVRARDRLAVLVDGEHGPLRVHFYGQDWAGRMRAGLTAADRPLAEVMVSEGLAQKSVAGGGSPWCPGDTMSLLSRVRHWLSGSW